MSEGVVTSAGPRERAASLLADPTLGAVQTQVEAETAIYDADHPVKNIFLIESGQVRLYQVGQDGSTRLVSILGKGDWLGLTGLGGAATYGMRAVTVTPISLWNLPIESLDRRINELPPLASEMIYQLALRLRQSHDAAARLVFDDCNQRLVKTLVHFSETAAASPGEAGSVVLHITHQQLAQAVGAARETVSLALTQLRQRNLLRTGRNRLLFNPEALRQFSERMSEGAPIAATARSDKFAPKASSSEPEGTASEGTADPHGDVSAGDVADGPEAGG